jgi:glycosyltransferase involved in cell wall biosynthesis
VVILTEIIAPYRIPVFNALAARVDVNPHVIFLSENDPSLREWEVHKNEIKFSYEVLPSWRRRLGKYNLLLNCGVGAALSRSNADVILCGGYNYVASWQAAVWAIRRGVPLLLWCESTAHDLRRKYSTVEFMKAQFTRRCEAFVAAGKSSQEYLLSLGAPGPSIFAAPDAVDVEFYSRHAERTRRHADEIRARHGLPARYFLCAGRLVREKGVFDVLSAYAELDENIRAGIGLVFAGDGTARSELERYAAEIRGGSVKFCGFVQREQLSELYALAHALVFPTHSDPWGLVVNEAMACGLPIIASEIAGCVPDLVQDDWNGILVAPHDLEGLTGAMHKLASQPALAERMAECSVERIQSYTPALWADGLMKALTFACNGAE